MLYESSEEKNMLSRIDQDLHFAQTALDIRARRQEILASNLANADTPNYKARDINFSDALQSALNGTGSSLSLATDAAGQLSGSAASGTGMGANVLYRSSLQPSLDGNTVDMNVERADFADNAMHYRFLLDSLTGTFKEMALAVGPSQ